MISEGSVALIAGALLVISSRLLGPRRALADAYRHRPQRTDIHERTHLWTDGRQLWVQTKKKGGRRELERPGTVRAGQISGKNGTQSYTRPSFVRYLKRTYQPVSPV